MNKNANIRSNSNCLNNIIILYSTCLQCTHYVEDFNNRIIDNLSSEMKYATLKIYADRDDYRQEKLIHNKVMPR